MDFSELTKKENVYKAIAVGLILVFVLSSYATGILGGSGSSSGGAGNATPGYYEAEISVNATVEGYQPYIVTSLKDQAVAEGIRALPDVEDMISTSQGYVVSLRSESNITGVYSYLLSMNVTGKANAVLSLPPTIEIETANGTEKVSGAEISARIEPLFEEGETVEIRLAVGIEDMRIVNYGQASVLPSLGEFGKNATVVALVDTKTVARVPWEERYGVQEEIADLTAQYGEENVSYARRDFVIANLTNGTRPAYVTFVAGDTVFVGNMTDMERIAEDIPGAVFPDSSVTISGSVAAGGLEAAPSYIYNMKVSEGGEEFFFALQSPNGYSQNDTVEVTVSAYSVKGRITSIMGAREALQEDEG